MSGSLAEFSGSLGLPTLSPCTWVGRKHRLGEEHPCGGLFSKGREVSSGQPIPRWTVRGAVSETLLPGTPRSHARFRHTSLLTHPRIALLSLAQGISSLSLMMPLPQIHVYSVLYTTG